MATERSRTVTVGEGIRYGFGLLGYAAGVAIVGGGLFFFGIALVGDPVGGTGFGIVGPLMVLAGIVVFYAGALGLGYKVIADGVAAGMGMADE